MRTPDLIIDRKEVQRITNGAWKSKVPALNIYDVFMNKQIVKILPRAINIKEKGFEAWRKQKKLILRKNKLRETSHIIIFFRKQF